MITNLLVFTIVSEVLVQCYEVRMETWLRYEYQLGNTFFGAVEAANIQNFKIPPCTENKYPYKMLNNFRQFPALLLPDNGKGGQTSQTWE